MSAGDWKRMMRAIQENDFSLLRYYLEIGVNPNAQHPEYLNTPLIEAIVYNRIEMVEYLLKQGADPNLKAGFSTDNPLRIAKEYKNKAIIKLLKSYLPKKRFFLFR